MRILVVSTRLDPAGRVVADAVDAALAAGDDVVVAAPFTAFGRRPWAQVPCLDLPLDRPWSLASRRARRRVLRARGPEHDLVVDLDAVARGADPPRVAEASYGSRSASRRRSASTGASDAA